MFISKELLIDFIGIIRDYYEVYFKRKCSFLRKSQNTESILKNTYFSRKTFCQTCHESIEEYVFKQKQNHTLQTVTNICAQRLNSISIGYLSLISQYV